MMKKESKMTRADMWAWFTSKKPDKYKIPRGKKKEKENDAHKIRYTATVTVIASLSDCGAVTTQSLLAFTI